MFSFASLPLDFFLILFDADDLFDRNAVGEMIAYQQLSIFSSVYDFSGHLCSLLVLFVF
jgi:hypothetical protein